MAIAIVYAHRSARRWALHLGGVCAAALARWPASSCRVRARAPVWDRCSLLVSRFGGRWATRTPDPLLVREYRPSAVLTCVSAGHPRAKRARVSPNTVQLRLQGCSLGGVPRAGWMKPESERRLSDLVSVGLLTRVFPPELVDEVIAAAGRTEQRHRSLPARVMAYFAIGMALHSEGSYEDVLALLTDGLAWASGGEPVVLPSKSAIFQARARLGAGAVARALFARVAVPLATPARRVVAGGPAAGRDRRDVSGCGGHARRTRSGSGGRG